MPNFICVRCKNDKPEEEFYFCKTVFRGGAPKRQSYCKACNAEETLARQRKNKKQAVDYAGGSCVICGYNKCLDALQFHHLDPNKKEFGVGSKHLRSFKNIKAEIDKCILLCSRCHVEVHAGVSEPPSKR